MIVLSLLLVIVAAVTLLAGFFSDGLTLIWVSIGSCVLSIATLALGVMQRRRATPEPSPPSSYGPGAPGPKPAPAQLATVADTPRQATEVIPKAAAPVAAARRADVDAEAAAEAAAEATSADEAPAEIIRPVKAAPAKKAAKKTTRKKATRPSAKKATKKSTRKKATRKAAKKTTRKKATKKAAKKSASRTTGAAARTALAQIKGVGPAKQDALLKKFKSLEAIRGASIDELSDVDGVGPTAAKTIKDALS